MCNKCICSAGGTHFAYYARAAMTPEALVLLRRLPGNSLYNFMQMHAIIPDLNNNTGVYSVRSTYSYTRV